MKAAVITGYGDNSMFELREVPSPRPAAGQVRVKLAASSINPVDAKVRSGAMKAVMPVTFPAILGHDIAGEIVELGSGVTGFKVGDRVFGMGKSTFAEEAVVDAKALAHVPAGLDLVAAAALPLVLSTGAQLVSLAVKPTSGQRILVTGATGSSGRAAVFVATQLGVQVVAGVRGKYRAEAEKLGAVEVLALDDADALGRLQPVDAIADTVGGELTQKLLGKLKPGGTVGSVVGEPAGAKERGFRVNAIYAKAEGDSLEELGRAVQQGKFAIPIADRFPISDVRKAMDRAEHAGGKVLLTF